MVWLNTQCSNQIPPPGTFGGSMCTCPKCKANREKKNLTFKFGKPIEQYYEEEIFKILNEDDDKLSATAKIIKLIFSET